MRKTLSILTTAAVVVFTSVAMPYNAKAVDMDAGYSARRDVAALPSNCQDLWRCYADGCKWHRVCTRPCPDNESCYPLYGAYGPYGGTAYWGAYTDSGWGR
jgi:hypothetical protein